MVSVGEGFEVWIIGSFLFPGSDDCLNEEDEEDSRNGQVPVIDRCNFDRAQRKHFLDLAFQYQFPVDCVVIHLKLEECLRRCRQRKGHKTLAQEQANRVIQRMAGDWEMVGMNEGFRSVRFVTND